MLHVMYIYRYVHISQRICVWNHGQLSNSFYQLNVYTYAMMIYHRKWILLLSDRMCLGTDSRAVCLPALTVYCSVAM